MEGAGVRYHSMIDASLGLTVCALVAEGCGIGIVDSEAARVQRRTDVVFRCLNPKIRVPIFIFRQRNRTISKLAEAFSASLRPPPTFGFGSQDEGAGS
jgi:DNA-binding transcriptional LysR family regulator